MMSVGTLGRAAGVTDPDSVAGPRGSQGQALTFAHHNLQEKERNARRKKKKAPAVASEEAAFPPAVEDEEMEGSGASGNEEEMVEEAEGKGGQAGAPSHWAGLGRGSHPQSRPYHRVIVEIQQWGSRQ